MTQGANPAKEFLYSYVTIYVYTLVFNLSFIQKIPDAVKNRQRSHESSVGEPVSTSSNITDADQGHLSNESDVSN